MTDVHSKETRSKNMARIKAKDTKPEVLVRKHLFSKGFRYRLNVKKLPGKPDIVFAKYKTVIFINGCFWHGHEGCHYFTIPKTRTEWWSNKIQKNKERDKQEYEKLQQMGWRVLVVWECQLKPKERLKTLQSLELTLSKQILQIYHASPLSL
ncbi:MAG TPA: very short patch repair endonuclease [Bacteroidales bacterium]